MEQRFIVIKQLMGVVERLLVGTAFLTIVLSASVSIYELYIGSVVLSDKRWVYQSIIFLAVVAAAMFVIHASGYITLAIIKSKIEKDKPESVKLKEFGTYMIKMSEELEKEEKKKRDTE